MEVYKGTDRTALIGRHYTLKVARTNPRGFLQYAQSIRERRGLEGVVNAWKALSADQHHSLKNFLLHGIVANRRERRVATHEGIVIPTRSILGGLANFQPTVPGTGLDDRAVHSAFVEQLGSKVTALGHMLEDTNNIGVDDGRVKFVDGGSRGLERLMETNPDAIHRALGSLTLQLET